MLAAAARAVAVLTSRSWGKVMQRRRWTARIEHVSYGHEVEVLSESFAVVIAPPSAVASS